METVTKFEELPGVGGNGTHATASCAQHTTLGKAFPYRSKCILAFQVGCSSAACPSCVSDIHALHRIPSQHVHGHEVCFFAMYVQEYGSNCPEPNTNRVYARTPALQPRMWRRSRSCDARFLMFERTGIYRTLIRCDTSAHNLRDTARPCTIRSSSTISPTHEGWGSPTHTSGSPLQSRATIISSMHTRYVLGGALLSWGRTLTVLQHEPRPRIGDDGGKTHGTIEAQGVV